MFRRSVNAASYSPIGLTDPGATHWCAALPGTVSGELLNLLAVVMCYSSKMDHWRSHFLSPLHTLDQVFLLLVFCCWPRPLGFCVRPRIAYGPDFLVPVLPATSVTVECVWWWGLVHGRLLLGRAGCHPSPRPRWFVCVLRRPRRASSRAPRRSTTLNRAGLCSPPGARAPSSPAHGHSLMVSGWRSRTNG